MGERAPLSVKKPETKRENSASQKRKPDFSQSISSPIDHILHLQRTIGNQAVLRLFKSGVIQAKLRINQPNDIYEQEADKMAEVVMRMPEIQVLQQPEEEKEKELIQTKLIAEQITPLVQRQEVEPEEEEEEEAILQTKGHTDRTPEVSPELESRIKTLRGGGQPLPESARAFFEPRFGYDFSAVRVHSDGKADRLAQAFDAWAFTQGRDIVFRAGQYASETAAGKKLLAHELTHVVQQHSAGKHCQVQLKAAEEKTYIVREGETLKDIADKLGVAVEDLVAKNISKLRIWTTPSGKKIRGFNAGDAIVIPAAKAPAKEKREEGRSWREYAEKIAEVLAVPFKAAWNFLTGLVGEEEKKTWTPCTMPGPVRGGPNKKSKMDASFLPKLNNICGRMKAQDYDTKIFWGYRTEAEQVHIATAGRSFNNFKTFMDSEVKKGHITKEKAKVYIDYYDPDKGKHAMRKEREKYTKTLKSMHRKGKAADVVHPTAYWNPPEGEAYWNALKTSAEAEGLQIGPPASDKAHVQVP